MNLLKLQYIINITVNKVLQLLSKISGSTANKIAWLFCTANKIT